MGPRFGFVWFFDVRNTRRLEHELDSIRIGAMKLYVNLSRYSRESLEKKVAKLLGKKEENVAGKQLGKKKEGRECYKTDVIQNRGIS